MRRRRMSLEYRELQYWHLCTSQSLGEGWLQHFQDFMGIS
jgi:hypothetical protein